MITVAKTSPRAAIDAEVETSFRAGIMHCLVSHCHIDSAIANQLTDGIANAPNTLNDRKRDAREKIIGAILATMVDEKSANHDRQTSLW